MVLFETERLIVRRFRQADAEGFFRLNGDSEVVKYIRPVKSKAECGIFLAENIRLYHEGSLIGRYAVLDKENQAFIGSYAFLYLKGEADIHTGYALIRDAWGKGFATELVQKGIAFFFENTNKDALYAITESVHTASQKVLLKSGMLSGGQTEESGKMLNLYYIFRNQFLSEEATKKL